jgi:hypothetical protein
MKQGNGIKGRDDRSSGIEILMSDVFVKINPMDPLRLVNQVTWQGHMRGSVNVGSSQCRVPVQVSDYDTKPRLVPGLYWYIREESVWVSLQWTDHVQVRQLVGVIFVLTLLQLSHVDHKLKISPSRILLFSVFLVSTLVSPFFMSWGHCPEYTSSDVHLWRGGYVMGTIGLRPMSPWHVPLSRGVRPR